MAIRILLADGNPEFLCSLRAVLERNRDMIVVAEACSGLDAVRRTIELRPDVVLLGARMPGMSGIDAARTIVESGTASAAIILSVFAERPYVVEAARAGAVGYLAKSADHKELADAVRTASKGGSCFLPLSRCGHVGAELASS